MVTKTLRWGTFIWDDELKIFTLRVVDQTTGESHYLVLNKIYAFALQRFIVRISQRNFFRRRAVKHDK